MNNRSKARTTEKLLRLKRGRPGAGPAATEPIMKSLLLRQVPLLQSIPGPAWLKDRRARFVAVNEAFASAKGVASEDLIGKTEYAIGRRPAALRGVRDDLAALKSGSAKRTEESLSCPDGRVLCFETIRSPIRDDGGQIIGLAGIVRDITREREMEAELAGYRERLEALVRERTIELASLNEDLQREMERWKQIDANRRRKEARYRAVVENQTEFICRFLPDGSLSFVNQAYCRFAGKSRKELLGRSFFSLIPLGLREKVMANVQSLTGDNPAVTHEYSFSSPSGVLRWYQWTEMAVFGEGGEIAEYQAVGRDITDMISHEQRIEDLNSELEARVAELRRTNEELKTFSYSVSHDLKTPIIATLGLLRLVGEQHGQLLDQKGKLLISGAEKCVRRMEDMIDDLLAFFRVRAATVEYGWIDMELLVKEVFDEISLVFAGLPLDLKLGYLPAVQGDAGMIRQALANLIGNAIKFSKPKGDVRIEVGSRVEEGRVVYYVKDNGVGFSPEDADRIFKLFERLHSREEFEGTGIGLAIVERVAKRHGGTVWAEGAANNGATFYFSLPYAGEKK